MPKSVFGLKKTMVADKVESKRHHSDRFCGRLLLSFLNHRQMFWGKNFSKISQ